MFSDSAPRAGSSASPTFCAVAWSPNGGGKGGLMSILFWHAGACHWPSDDALALRSGPLDPIRERLHDLLQELAGAVADELAMFVEELVDMANIGFRLLHG